VSDLTVVGSQIRREGVFVFQFLVLNQDILADFGLNFNSNTLFEKQKAILSIDGISPKFELKFAG
jgi:hypothetical protein